MTTTDLQKLLAVDTTSQRFKNAVAAYLAAMHGAQGEIIPPLYYAIKAWERTKIAPDLAARVLELEAENKRLREAIVDARLIAVDAQLRATYQKTALERISDLLRTALKGGEI